MCESRYCCFASVIALTALLELSKWRGIQSVTTGDWPESHAELVYFQGYCTCVLLSLFMGILQGYSARGELAPIFGPIHTYASQCDPSMITFYRSVGMAVFLLDLPVC